MMRSTRSCCSSCPPGRRLRTGRRATCCSAAVPSGPAGDVRADRGWCRRRSRRRCGGDTAADRGAPGYRDAELGGVRIPAGASWRCHWGGQPDPERYADPDAFDVMREGGQAISFGSAFTSAGMHLARMEMRVLLNAVLDRLPGLRLDPDAEDVHVTADFPVAAKPAGAVRPRLTTRMGRSCPGRRSADEANGRSPLSLQPTRSRRLFASESAPGQGDDLEGS